MINIKVTDVFTPSDKQQSVGIHGTVNLEVVGDNGHTIIKANGISIRKNGNDGSRFLAEPSYKVSKDGQDKYWSHFKMYPGKKDDHPYNEAQRAESDKLNAEVLRILDAGGSRQNQDKPTTTATAAPAAATSTPNNNPWD